MGMFDDLDPDFISSPGPALPIVAARVHAVRKRRAIVVASACGAAVVVLLGSVAFGGGAKNPDRLTVAREVTTTTDDSSSTTDIPLVTAPSSSTSTTIPATTTTATLPIAADTATTSPETTTTQSPAHITFAFDRDRLVIQSGTTATFSFTLTNDGDGPGDFGVPTCPNRSLWPYQLTNDRDFDPLWWQPVPWPEPANLAVYCASLDIIHVAPHSSQTVDVHVGGGYYDQRMNLVPAPPGQTAYVVDNGMGPGTYHLPVTITPPATPPLTVDHPSEVTTASNAQHWLDFTITNHLPFPVRYTDQGPCSLDTGVPCYATSPNHVIDMDMRLPPYDTAVRPLYLSRFLLGAHEVKTAHAQVHGTTSLEDIFLGSPAMPPGVYHFDWDGEKVKFTVTP